MARRRRVFEVFTLSFLDCICCGFGAVILFYTIVSAQAGVVHIKNVDQLTAEVNRLKDEVLTGTRGLAPLRNTLEKTRDEAARASAQTNLILAELARKQEEVSVYDATSLARREHIEKLKADVRSLEAGNKRLKAGSDERAAPGQDVTSFRKIGGERRYITGLRMRGKRILILLDVSGSMLHEDLVEILRLRNTDDAHKRAAAKWRRAVETVNWLLTQVPPGSEYQIYTFNTKAQPLLPDSGKKWISRGDTPRLERAMQALQMIVPAGGTSLQNAFTEAKTLFPLPDQLVLITDGLPTQGKTVGLHKYVNSAARERLFDQAIEEIPHDVPIDCVLLPMKGDLEAAHRFWHLARMTDGTLIMPAKDWP